jgi:DNA-3-methyladenine glycosylase II
MVLYGGMKVNTTSTSANEIAEYLIKKDPILGKVVSAVGPLEASHKDNYFLSLIESIISQQLSVKVADVIFARFENLFPEKNITPEKVLEIDTDVMRQVGMSYGKIKYVKSLAQHVIDSPLLFEKFDSLSEEEIIAELTQVKGIGKWTAEMFLMFTMGKPDIFSYGDLGLKNAIKKLYGIEELTEEKAKEITDIWKPYRSYGSRYLWRSLDQKLVMEEA